MTDERASGRDWIEARFDDLAEQVAEVSRKSDRNHDDAQERLTELVERVGELEGRQAGHTDDEIKAMIDERLEHWAGTVLPDLVTEAINEGLRRPLNTLEENTKALNDLRTSTKPLVDICETATNLHRALKWIAVPAGALVTIAAALTILGWLS